MRRLSAFASPGPSQDGPFLFRAALPALLAALVASGLAAAAPAQTPTPAAVELENTHWSLEAVGGVKVKAGPAHPAYILFRPTAGGRLLGGTSGCNGLKGSYDTFAGRLRVKATVLTGKPCPAAYAAREAKLVEALGLTANYRIAGTTLELLRTDGKVLARFSAR